MASTAVILIEPAQSPSRNYPSNTSFVANSGNAKSVVVIKARSPNTAQRYNDFAASAAIYDSTSVILNSSSLTGAVLSGWQGNSNSQNTLDLSTISNVSGTLSASWTGNTGTQGNYLIPYDVQQRLPISTDTPNSDQSAAEVLWNYFPLAVIPPVTPGGTPRDLTRYRKTFGSTRQQPVKLVVFKG
jgi:hypothetical protein